MSGEEIIEALRKTHLGTLSGSEHTQIGIGLLAIAHGVHLDRRYMELYQRGLDPERDPQFPVPKEIEKFREPRLIKRGPVKYDEIRLLYRRRELEPIVSSIDPLILEVIEGKKQIKEKDSAIRSNIGLIRGLDRRIRRLQRRQSRISRGRGSSKEEIQSLGTSIRDLISERNRILEENRDLIEESHGLIESYRSNCELALLESVEIYRDLVSADLALSRIRGELIHEFTSGAGRIVLNYCRELVRGITQNVENRGPFPGYLDEHQWGYNDLLKGLFELLVGFSDRLDFFGLQAEGEENPSIEVLEKIDLDGVYTQMDELEGEARRLTGYRPGNLESRAPHGLELPVTDLPLRRILSGATALYRHAYLVNTTIDDRNEEIRYANRIEASDRHIEEIREIAKGTLRSSGKFLPELYREAVDNLLRYLTLIQEYTNILPLRRIHIEAGIQARGIDLISDTWGDQN